MTINHDFYLGLDIDIDPYHAGDASPCREVVGIVKHASMGFSKLREEDVIRCNRPYSEHEPIRWRNTPRHVIECE